MSIRINIELNTNNEHNELLKKIKLWHQAFGIQLFYFPIHVKK